MLILKKQSKITSCERLWSCEMKSYLVQKEKKTTTNKQNQSAPLTVSAEITPN